MLRKILIGLGVLAALIVILLVYANYRNRTLSPSGKVELAVNDLVVAVKYSRPSVRGRLIFGAEADGALQPYGKYWRLGANEATEITINKDVTVNDVPLKAGTYRLYAVPGASTFTLGVNSELGKWGAWEPDYTKDLFTTEIPVKYLTKPIEQFTVRIEDGPNNGALVFFEWSDVQLVVPISLQ